MATAGTISHVFADTETQTAAAADRIAAALADGGSLVLTGGSTPGPLYDLLSARDLPWDKVQITLSDERWVGPHHPDSNERLVRRRLLQGAAAAATFTPLKVSAPDPWSALTKVERAVRSMPRPFACVLLGMGEDGHVASLFPGQAAPEALLAGGPLVAAAHAPNGVERMSLTFAALLDANLIVLFVRGAAKRRVLKDALAGTTPHLPIAALLRQAICPVEVFWAP